jgi:hypothetical protein
MTNQEKLSRIVWVAFKSSVPVGMGFLHHEVAMSKTEKTVVDFNSVKTNEDGSINFYADYLYGRMMKTGFQVTADGTVKVSPEIPRLDYQSWAKRYENATEMIECAFGVKSIPKSVSSS